jgi:hypothetical protein
LLLASCYTSAVRGLAAGGGTRIEFRGASIRCTSRRIGFIFSEDGWE